MKTVTFDETSRLQRWIELCEKGHGTTAAEEIRALLSSAPQAPVINQQAPSEDKKDAALKLAKNALEEVMEWIAAGPEGQRVHCVARKAVATVDEAMKGGESSKDQKDAERYRWLVNNSYDREWGVQFHIWKHTWGMHSQTGEPIEWKCRMCGPTIDAAIDAAMKGGE